MRITSGSAAAVPRQPVDSSTIAGAPEPSVILVRGRRPRPERRRAEHHQPGQPDERHPGEAGGQRDRRPGQREQQPEPEPRYPELLHQRLQQEPLGDEPQRERQPGQRERADGQPGAAPRQPPGRSPQRVQVVVARRLDADGRARRDHRAAGEQQRLGGRVRDDLQRRGEQAGRDQPRIAHGQRRPARPRTRSRSGRCSPRWSTRSPAAARAARPRARSRAARSPRPAPAASRSARPGGAPSRARVRHRP